MSSFTSNNRVFCYAPSKYLIHPKTVLSVPILPTRFQIKPMLTKQSQKKCTPLHELKYSFQVATMLKTNWYSLVSPALRNFFLISAHLQLFETLSSLPNGPVERIGDWALNTLFKTGIYTVYIYIRTYIYIQYTWDHCNHNHCDKVRIF